MNAIIVLLVCFALVSCIAAPLTEFMGPNGNMVYAINCEASADCEEQARDLCPSGHNLIPVASGANDTSVKGGIGDTPVRRLAIECKIVL